MNKLFCAASVVLAGCLAGCGGPSDGDENAGAQPSPSSSSTSSGSTHGGGWTASTSSGASSTTSSGWGGSTTSTTTSSGWGGSTTSTTTSSGWAGSTSSTSTSSSSTSSTSSSGYGGASSSSSGYLACEYTVYGNTFDPENEPQLAAIDNNAILASPYVENEAWFESHGWQSISPAQAQSSTSSGGYFSVSDPGESFGLEEETPFRHKMMHIGGTEPLQRYAVSAEVKAAEAGATIGFQAAVRTSLQYQLPNGDALSRPFSQTILAAEQLTDEWTALSGNYNTVGTYTYFYMDADAGPFMYRNLRIESDGPLTPQPEFADLQAALAALPAEWQPDTAPFLSNAANNYAWLSNPVIHGGGAACNAGSVDGVSFPLHITPSVPRYRLKLALEITGPAAGSLSVDLYGTVNRGRAVIAPEAAELTYRNTVFSDDVEPGQVLEIESEFDYQPFDAMQGLVLSEAVEFLLRSVELERVYPTDPDITDPDITDPDITE